MSSCDASILDEIPDEIVKLTACIVKRWWASHGLPYVTDTFHVEPEVGIFVACYGFSRFLVLTFVSLLRYRWRMLAGVDHELLVTPGIYPHALATTARCLREMLAPLVMGPIVKAMVPEAKVMVLVAMMVKFFQSRTSMNEVVRCDWVVIFGL
jgi:hypothetical protein